MRKFWKPSKLELESNLEAWVRFRYQKGGERLFLAMGMRERHLVCGNLGAGMGVGGRNDQGAFGNSEFLGNNG